MPTFSQVYLETWEGTLGDWDVFTSGSMTVDLTTNNAIVGSQSLRIQSPDTIARANVMPKTTSGLHFAATTGKMRTLVKNIVAGGGLLIDGLSCQQSQRDITTAGSFYFAGYTFSPGTLRIGKATSGLSRTLSTLTSTALTFNVGDIICLELEWETSGSSVILTLRKGTTTDYSDLADVLTYTDSSSALLTTVGQGHCHASPAFSSSPEVRADQTTGFQEASAVPDLSWLQSGARVLGVRSPLRHSRQASPQPMAALYRFFFAT